MAGCLEYAPRHDAKRSKTIIIPSTELVRTRIIASARGGCGPSAPKAGPTRQPKGKGGAPWTGTTGWSTGGAPKVAEGVGWLASPPGKTAAADGRTPAGDGGTTRRRTREAEGKRGGGRRPHRAPGGEGRRARRRAPRDDGGTALPWRLHGRDAADEGGRDLGMEGEGLGGGEVAHGGVIRRPEMRGDGRCSPQAKGTEFRRRLTKREGWPSCGSTPRRRRGCRRCRTWLRAPEASGWRHQTQHRPRVHGGGGVSVMIGGGGVDGKRQGMAKPVGPTVACGGGGQLEAVEAAVARVGGGSGAQGVERGK
uniref:Uncharacterized protein n=1 Tax=Oryza sativa subsp. japonica TaxID=39947 RepID=Q69PT7_ORYSJ|nr:hypothetical protein [Oryza sativa Japonica Group]BAD33513.1 hypothetical protein [Oryza sativa Japonica Group]